MSSGTEGADRGKADGPLGRRFRETGGGSAGPRWWATTLGGARNSSRAERRPAAPPSGGSRIRQGRGRGPPRCAAAAKEDCGSSTNPPGKAAGRGATPSGWTFSLETNPWGMSGQTADGIRVPVVGHHPLHGLEREPVDAIQPPRNDQTGVDGNHGHGGEATLHRGSWKERTYSKGNPIRWGRVPVHLGRFGTSDHHDHD